MPLHPDKQAALKLVMDARARRRAAANPPQRPKPLPDEDELTIVTRAAAQLNDPGRNLYFNPNG